MNKNHSNILMLVVIALLVGAITWYILDLNQGSDTTSDRQGEEASLDTVQKLDKEARGALADGDYDEAAQLFERTADATSDEEEKARFLVRAGTSNFLTDEVGAQEKGIEQLKSVIRTSENMPEMQAGAITDLASIVCGSGCNEEIFEMVFEDEPFGQYKAEGNMAKSVANLYEWSLEIYPKSSTYARLMSWHGEQLILRSETMSAAEIAEHTEAILKYSSEADEIVQDGNPKERTLVSYYFWKGYSFGGLAIVDPETYGEDFERAYQRAIAIGFGAEPGSNLADSVVFAYYQYAALLNHIYGISRVDDVEENLIDLTNLVRGDESPENNQFLLMVGNELNNAGEQHGFVGQSIYTLGEGFQVFEQFLQEYGFDIS